MVKRVVVLVTALACASAFAPLSAQPRVTRAIRRAEEEAAEPAVEAPAEAAEEVAPAPAPVAASVPYVETLYGASKTFGEKVWDPLNLASIGTDGTVDFFRAAELKHGRIAMMACLGFLHHEAGIVFPGYLSVKENIAFSDLGAVNPVEAWNMMPYEGLLQVFGVIAVFEWYSMTHKKGKWAGADAWFTGLDSVVDQNFDPLGFGNADAAAVDRAKLQELEHGRLAMLGAMSVVAACEIPGSVPLLKL